MTSMSNTRSCIECRFYDGRVSQCRRYPPIRVTTKVTEFPEVKPHDWCGEFQINAAMTSIRD